MKRCKYALLLIIVVLPLILCSCVEGSYVTRGSVQNNTRSQMYMRYEYFDGYKQTTINVKDGVKTVNIEITSQSGSLDLYIAKDNDIEQAVFREYNIATGSYTAELTEPGKYTVRVNAAAHKGSYKIVWR